MLKYWSKILAALTEELRRMALILRRNFLKRLQTWRCVFVEKRLSITKCLFLLSPLMDRLCRQARLAWQEWGLTDKVYNKTYQCATTGRYLQYYEEGKENCVSNFLPNFLGRYGA